MSTIALTPRQYAHFKTINEQIAELDTQRRTYLELILDSSEAAGKNIQIQSITEKGIEYEEVPSDGPKLSE